MTHPRTSLLRRLLLLPCLAGLGPLASAGDDLELIQFLDNTGAAPAASAKARWRDKGDAIDFQVEVDDLPAGTYTLVVGGAHRGGFAVNGFGEGEIEFESPADPPKALLDFAVLDASMQVVRDGVTYFDDVFRPTGGGGGPGGGDDGGGTLGNSKLEVFMMPVGSDPDATGRLRHRIKGTTTRFDAEFERLDAGAYELVVGGAVVAAFTASGTEAEEFEFEFRQPPEPGHLLLDFDPLGQTVELLSDSEVVLSAVMPAHPSVSGVKTPSSGKSLSKDLGGKRRDALKVRFHGSGAVAGARGSVVLDATGDPWLDLSFRGLEPGAHELEIDGHTALTLGVGTDGRAEATLPASGPWGSSVQGRLVTLGDGTATVLAMVFPISAPHALGKRLVHRVGQRTVIDLVNTGVDLDARARLVRTWREDGARLRVRLGDLPLGQHQVFAGGVPIGTVTTGKQGQNHTLLLSTSPDGAALPLPLEPAGVRVDVRTAGGALILTGELP